MSELDDILKDAYTYKLPDLTGEEKVQVINEIKKLFLEIVKDSTAYVHTAGDNSVWRSEQSLIRKVKEL